jgi:phosphate starvation-inducible protein PhoH and related proteins
MSKKPTSNTKAVKRTSKRTYEEVFTRKDLAINILAEEKDIKPKFKTENQKVFWNLIDEKEITICAGLPGSGKTYVALSKALSLLKNPNNKIDRIVLVKPAIEAEEKMGFLPGDADEKMAPYMFPTFYTLEKIISSDTIEKLRSAGIIQVLPVAFARGLTIDNSVVVADEMQNVTPSWMKTLLTRIGESSKFILLGDVEQSDRFRKKEESGLYDALERYTNLTKFGIFRFVKGDCVRNPIIEDILKTWEKK